jgi:hypothetical protein
MPIKTKEYRDSIKIGEIPKDFRPRFCFTKKLKPVFVFRDVGQEDFSVIAVKCHQFCLRKCKLKKITDV